VLLTSPSSSCVKPVPLIARAATLSCGPSARAEGSSGRLTGGSVGRVAHAHGRMNAEAQRKLAEIQRDLGGKEITRENMAALEQRKQ
jgi:hypothetical protein